MGAGLRRHFFDGWIGHQSGVVMGGGGIGSGGMDGDDMDGGAMGVVVIGSGYMGGDPIPSSGPLFEGRSGRYGEERYWDGNGMRMGGGDMR